MSTAARIPLPQADVRALEAIYAELPVVECKGLCQQACGPIGLTRLENRRIRRAIGREPSARGNLSCSLLTPDGRCEAYAFRPLICRLWGVVEAMRCPFGCVPSRWATDDEAKAWLHQASVIGDGHIVVEVRA